jgi:hypothetical protein
MRTDVANTPENGARTVDYGRKRPTGAERAAAVAVAPTLLRSHGSRCVAAAVVAIASLALLPPSDGPYLPWAWVCF